MQVASKQKDVFSFNLTEQNASPNPSKDVPFQPINYNRHQSWIGIRPSFPALLIGLMPWHSD